MHRRVSFLLPLGFAAGLPLLLVGSTLSSWLTGVSDLTTIGLFSLAGLPYSIKFLWAPLLDRLPPPMPAAALDRRRGWLLPVQALCALALAAMGALGPTPGSGQGSRALAPLFCATLLCATLAATQDVLVDAYRADVLPREERGAGSAAYLIGYRLAVVVSGALALSLAEHLRWSRVYLLMAGLVLCGTLATWLAPPIPQGPDAPRDAAPARERGPGQGGLTAPLRALLARPGAPLMLAFVALYKLGDAVALGLINPFLLLLGYRKAEVGTLANGLGLFAMLGGTLLGGALLPRLGPRRALLWFGAAQALANLGYAALGLMAGAAGGARPPLTALTAVVAIDQLAGGMASCALIAYLLGCCEPRHSATHYALLSSLSGVLGRLLGGGAGYLAARLGFPTFFFLTMVCALPGLWLARRLPRA